MRVEAQAHIDRPPEQVFRFLANAENMPRWRTDLESVEKVSEGPPQEGSVFRFARVKPRLESTVKWVEFEPCRLLRWQGAKERIGPGTLQFSGSHTLTPEEGGTRVRSIFITKFGGLLKLVGPLGSRSIKRELDANFKTLKQVLESEPRDPAGELG